MDNTKIEKLRNLSRKLIRELGLLQVDPDDTSVTPIHWHALVEIQKEPGITISKLGELLIISIYRISRITSSLYKKGFIEFKSGLDKREKLLYLSTKGQNEVLKIDDFSEKKILGAFKYLTTQDMSAIIHAIDIYSAALEKHRLGGREIKICTLPTSRTVRKQIVTMISQIQRSEFNITSSELNHAIIKAEQVYYYNSSYNFWYATDSGGKIVGSIGLKKLNDEYAEIQKLFVLPEYRGQGISKKLMDTLITSAAKHRFKQLFLGTVKNANAAHKFYTKYGFEVIKSGLLPKQFVANEFDSIFFKFDMTTTST